MTKVKTWILAAGFLGLAGVAQAATTYTCTMRNTSHSMVPEALFIAHDVEAGRVVVSDPIVLHFEDGPVEGKLAKLNDKRATFVWSVNGLRTTNGRPVRLRYTADIIRATGQLKLFGRASEVRPINGLGDCDIKQTK